MTIPPPHILLFNIGYFCFHRLIFLAVYLPPMIAMFQLEGPIVEKVRTTSRIGYHATHVYDIRLL